MGFDGTTTTATAKLHAESASDTASRMADRWGASAGPRIANFGPGLGAAVLNARPAEVESPPSEAHILTFVDKGERRHRHWRDGKPVSDGPLPSRSVNIVPAGSRPRAVISEPIRVLHLYLPHGSLISAAERANGAGARALEVIDPLYAPDPSLSALLQNLEDCLTGQDPPSALWLEALANAVIARVIHRWSNLSCFQPHASGGLGAAQLQRVRARMLDDLGREPDLAELAALANLSPEHFCRAFRRSTGLPPHRWLSRQRIERAKSLLLDDPGLGVAEVASMTGYGDPSYFARTFKQSTGVTPLAYRRARLS